MAGRRESSLIRRGVVPSLKFAEEAMRRASNKLCAPERRLVALAEAIKWTRYAHGCVQELEELESDE